MNLPEISALYLAVMVATVLLLFLNVSVNVLRLKYTFSTEEPSAAMVTVSDFSKVK